MEKELGDSKTLTQENASMFGVEVYTTVQTLYNGLATTVPTNNGTSKKSKKLLKSTTIALNQFKNTTSKLDTQENVWMLKEIAKITEPNFTNGNVTMETTKNSDSIDGKTEATSYKLFTPKKS